MYKFILRNGKRKRGKVLYTVYNSELLSDRVRKIANRIYKNEFDIDEDSYIDLERNNMLEKTIYALEDGTFSSSDFNEMENYCERLNG